MAATAALAAASAAAAVPLPVVDDGFASDESESAVGLSWKELFEAEVKVLITLMAAVDKNVDPLEFMKINEHKLEMISLMARATYAGQATSGGSERVASAAKLVLTDHRLRLTSSRVRKLVSSMMRYKRSKLEEKIRTLPALPAWVKGSFKPAEVRKAVVKPLAGEVWTEPIGDAAAIDESTETIAAEALLEEALAAMALAASKPA